LTVSFEWRQNHSNKRKTAFWYCRSEAFEGRFSSSAPRILLGVLLVLAPVFKAQAGTYEKRKDARTAREWEVGLPDELGEAKRRELAVRPDHHTLGQLREVSRRNTGAGPRARIARMSDEQQSMAAPQRSWGDAAHH
jgi:hypothetical protein